MTDKSKKQLQYLVFLGIGIALLVYAFRSLDLNKLEESIATANVWYLLLTVVVGFISFYMRALRWRMLMIPLGKKPDTHIVAMAVMIGYFINLVTPRLGEIARCGIIYQYEKLPVEKVAGTMVTERLIDVISLLILFLATLIFNYNEIILLFGDDLKAIDTYTILYMIIGVIIFAIVAYMIYKWVMNWMKNNKGELHDKILSIIYNIKDGLLSVRKVHNKLLFLVYTILMWFCYMLMVYLGFLAFPDLQFLGFNAAFSIVVFGSFGMIITPGGLGAYQIIVQKILHTLYGIENNLAGSFGFISWFMQTIVLIVSGAISYAVLPIYASRKKQNHELE